MVELVASDIEKALRKQRSLSIVVRSIQKMKMQANISLRKEVAKSSSKQNPHEA
jgi:hypothetical protein